MIGLQRKGKEKAELDFRFQNFAYAEKIEVHLAANFLQYQEILSLRNMNKSLVDNFDFDFLFSSLPLS